MQDDPLPDTCQPGMKHKRCGICPAIRISECDLLLHDVQECSERQCQGPGHSSKKMHAGQTFPVGACVFLGVEQYLVRRVAHKRHTGQLFAEKAGLRSPSDSSPLREHNTAGVRGLTPPHFGAHCGCLHLPSVTAAPAYRAHNTAGTSLPKSALAKVCLSAVHMS